MIYGGSSAFMAFQECMYLSALAIRAVTLYIPASLRRPGKPSLASADANAFAFCTTFVRIGFTIDTELLASATARAAVLATWWLLTREGTIVF